MAAKKFLRVVGSAGMGTVRRCICQHIFLKKWSQKGKKKNTSVRMNPKLLTFTCLLPPDSQDPPDIGNCQTCCRYWRRGSESETNSDRYPRVWGCSGQCWVVRGYVCACVYVPGCFSCLEGSCALTEQLWARIPGFFRRNCGSGDLDLGCWD